MFDEISRMERITKLQNGDTEIFGEIFREFNGKLEQFIFHKTRSEYYAHEVTQLTFIKLWERRMSLKADIPIASQIFQIAKTTMIDVLRKMERERLKIVHINAGKVMPHLTGYESIELKDAETILNRALDKMPPMRKKVCRLRIENQFSYKEISETLSISIKTVNKHLELAMRQLRPFFETLLIIIAFLVK